MEINWSNGWANVAWSQRDPSCNTVEIVKATDKAVQLKTGRYAAWFPKSAFQVDKHQTCFEVRNWFKRTMTNYQMKAIGFAA